MENRKFAPQKKISSPFKFFFVKKKAMQQSQKWNHTEAQNGIDDIMSRVTLPGSIFLGLIAILPAFAMLCGVNNQFASFYGGTSLLILVGVVLDTLQQIESHLLMRHYDGLMKTGRLKGRSGM